MNAIRYLEDYRVGEEYVTPSVTVTETHVVNWAALTQDNFWLHMSEEEARKSEWGGRIAHGMLGLALSVGLWTRLPVSADMAAIAYLGLKDWKFVKPIRIGDTIHTRGRIIEVRPSAGKPDRGIVRASKSVVNQRGEVVQTGEDAYMVARRPDAGNGPKGEAR